MTVPESNTQSPDIVVGICGIGRCEPKNGPLRQEIETACGEPLAADAPAKILQIGKHIVRVRCTHCLFTCVDRNPRAEVTINGDTQPVVVSSLALLEKQLDSVQGSTPKNEDRK